jgi:RNA polymerase-binding transcription factor DksA
MGNGGFMFCSCGEDIDPRRYVLGYRTCLECGEKQAKQIRHTVAPMHKGNYMLITDRKDLVGLNNKGGLVK